MLFVRQHPYVAVVFPLCPIPPTQLILDDAQRTTFLSHLLRAAMSRSGLIFYLPALASFITHGSWAAPTPRRSTPPPERFLRHAGGSFARFSFFLPTTGIPSVPPAPLCCFREDSGKQIAQVHSGVPARASSFPMHSDAVTFHDDLLRLQLGVEPRLYLEPTHLA